jgi:hypothetical protein
MIEPPESGFFNLNGVVMETEALRLVFCGVFFFCFGISTAAFVGDLTTYGSDKAQGVAFYAIMIFISLVIAGLITTATFSVGKIF